MLIMEIVSVSRGRKAIGTEKKFRGTFLGILRRQTKLFRSVTCHHLALHYRRPSRRRTLQKPILRNSRTGRNSRNGRNSNNKSKISRNLKYFIRVYHRGNSNAKRSCYISDNSLQEFHTFFRKIGILFKENSEKNRIFINFVYSAAATPLRYPCPYPPRMERWVVYSI